MNKTDLERHLGVSRATLKKMIDEPPKVESCGIKGQHVLFDDAAVKELEKRNRGRARSVVMLVEKSSATPDGNAEDLQQLHRQHLDRLAAEVNHLGHENKILLDRVEFYEKLIDKLTDNLTGKAAKKNKSKSNSVTSEKEDWRAKYFVDDVDEVITLRPSAPKEIEKADKDFVEKIRDKEVPKRAAQKSTSRKSKPVAKKLVKPSSTPEKTPETSTVTADKPARVRKKKASPQRDAVVEIIKKIFPNKLPQRLEKAALDDVMEALQAHENPEVRAISKKYLQDIVSRIRKEIEVPKT
jgi:hypothetical protein